MAINDTTKIDALLTRGVERVYPSREYLETRLKGGERLTVYLGIDPTGGDLHLGHAIVLRKLREFQDLGHEVILLIGDFTGMIGDPTDKSAARTRLTREQVLGNAKRYKEQAGKILSFSGANKADIRYNARWLARLDLSELIELAAHFTVQRMLERDMFERRMKEGKPIHLHEFLYPLMQAYDSVAMNIDGEIGGNDQTFNMLAGRDLLKAMRGKEKFVITTKLLADPDGKKMGKSEGNMVRLDEGPEEAYGKVMSWTDGMIVPGFELLTDEPMDEVAAVRSALEGGATNPRDAKARLAFRVVEAMHGPDAARAAADAFEKLFKEREVPEDIEEFPVEGKVGLLDLLVRSGLAASKSDARRLVDGGGIKVDGHAVEGYEIEIAPAPDAPVLIQKGKRHFVRAVHA